MSSLANNINNSFCDFNNDFLNNYKTKLNFLFYQYLNNANKNTNNTNCKINKKSEKKEFLNKNTNKIITKNNENTKQNKENKEKIKLINEILNKYERYINNEVVKTFNLEQLQNLKKLLDKYKKYTYYLKDVLRYFNEEDKESRKLASDIFVEDVEIKQDNLLLYTLETKETKEGIIQIKKYAINAKKFFTYLKLKAVNVSNINLKVNPFQKKVGFYVDKTEKEAYYVENKIYLKRPDYKILQKLNENEKQEILDDYYKIWGDKQKFIDVLDFIIYSRFLSNRKNAQLNINAPSDWGKGFFMTVLMELGAGFYIKQQQMKGDRPSGLNVEKLTRSICLLINEFKKYNNFLFEADNFLQVEAKFGAIYNIDIYARLFFNAQMSESLTGYVNEQITNRISLMKIDSNYLLKNSNVLKKYGKVKYKETIKEYVYNYFTKVINKLTKLDEDEADIKADKVVNKIIKKYKIKAKSTENLIVETIIEFLQDYKQYQEHIKNKEFEIINKKFTKKEQELYEQNIFYNENKQIYQIVKYENIIIQILKEKLIDRDYKKVEYSRGEIGEIFRKFLNAEYKNTHIADLKATKKALIITEQSINKYLQNEKIENEKDNINENKNIETKNSFNFSFADFYNASLSYTTKLLFNDLKTEKNEMLLLYNINSIFINLKILNKFKKIYNTNDANKILYKFIKDKVELLKELNLYKNEAYIKKETKEIETINKQYDKYYDEKENNNNNDIKEININDDFPF